MGQSGGRDVFVDRPFPCWCSVSTLYLGLRSRTDEPRFYPNGRMSCHVRVAFSVVDLEKDTEIGMSRLAEAIRARRRMVGLE